MTVRDLYRPILALIDLRQEVAISLSFGSVSCCLGEERAPASARRLSPLPGILAVR
jgi:hypothetical protein